MDALKAQFDRIAQQLGALTATQKMLVAALIAVMVLTMLYWGKYAGNAEMVSVLGDQTLTDDDIGPIIKQLKLSNVDFKVDAGKILVPAEQKNEIFSSLMFARALPQDTHSAFETMNKTLNPFTGATERDAAYTEATAMELSELIGMFPGVSAAKVIINAKHEIHIEGAIPPSATVMITTKGDAEHVKQLVRACADGVAHAVSGLFPDKISVIVNGVSIKVPNSDGVGMDAGDAADIREHTEARLEQKVRDVLNNIEGLTVSVNCDVEISTQQSTDTTYAKEKGVVTPQHTKTVTNDTSSITPTPHEPGASPNTGSNGSIALPADGSGGAGNPPNTTSSETNEIDYAVIPGTSTITKNTPAGKDSVSSATVRVPHSYLLAIFKQEKSENPNATTDMDAFSTAQLATIREDVKNIIGIKSDTQLSVNSYTDIAIPLAMATGPSTPSVAINTVTGHAREIGVAVLAVVSLMMMATMVRKATPPPLVLPTAGGSGAGAGSGAAASRAEAINQLGGGESVAGEVGGGSNALDGMEMDEDAVRTQQMLDQVSTMVKENPDGAASLVKRWLSRA